MRGIDACSYEEFQTALSVGVTAPFYLTKLLKDHFAEGGCTSTGGRKSRNTHGRGCNDLVFVFRSGGIYHRRKYLH